MKHVPLPSHVTGIFWLNYLLGFSGSQADLPEFLELQVQQAIFLTLYKLGTLSLAYSLYQYLTILP